MVDMSVKQRYQDETVARSYDQVRFVGLVGKTIDTLEKRAVQKALAAVRREIPSPRVLDIPCGTGRITELLLDQGLEVTGGDVSLPMLEVARQKCARYGDRVTFRHLDLDGLELPDRSFDLVTCIRLLNHLPRPDRQQILRELARVSRRFVILNLSFSSPFYQLASQLKRVVKVVMPKEPSTWSELRDEVAAAGLGIKDFYFELRYLSEVLVLLLEKAETDQEGSP